MTAEFDKSDSEEDRGSFLARANVWIDDRFNPVLVKEVRQSLRGKQFRSAFLFTVIFSVIIAVSIVLGNADSVQWNPIGPYFFQGIFSCLTVAVIGFVPMAAFTAMGAEWEENTYDMLILSRLRPRHIVMGKLLGVGSQALLYFSIFTPYVVFTFLLGGVDILLVLVCLPLLAVLSFALSAFAVGLSSLTSKRSARVIYMVILAAVLFGTCSAIISAIEGATRMGIDFSAPEFRIFFVLTFLIAAIVSGFSLVIATARLSHSEENRSSGIRVLTFVLAAACMAWISWALTVMGNTSEAIWILTTFVIAGVSVIGIFLVTERECLGLRVKNHLPQHPIMRLFALPWLPGGGRGALWLLMTLGMVVLWAKYLLIGSTSLFSGGVTGYTDFAETALWVTAGYSVIYLLLPAAVFSNKTLGIKRTNLARVLIPTFFILGLVGPPLFGFVIGPASLLDGDNVGNPFVTINGIGEDGESSLLILAIAGFVLLLQASRILRGVTEVTSAPISGAMASEATGITLERVPETELDD